MGPWSPYGSLLIFIPSLQFTFATKASRYNLLTLYVPLLVFLFVCVFVCFLFIYLFVDNISLYCQTILILTALPSLTSTQQMKMRVCFLQLLTWLAKEKSFVLTADRPELIYLASESKSSCNLFCSITNYLYKLLCHNQYPQLGKKKKKNLRWKATEIGKHAGGLRCHLVNNYICIQNNFSKFV